jgi:hypothetical protein
MSPLPARVLRIRELNDQLRRFPLPPIGELFLTEGVMALPVNERIQILDKVVKFEAFTPDNDPHGEHDFGAFEQDGTRYFWKIDYYDLSDTRHSSDPSNPEVTNRVLTIMRADEY